MRRIPADAGDVVADLDSKMYELALVVHAFAADVFVAMILRPGLLRFLQLSADAVATQVWRDRAQPVIEHARLELESDPETDRPIAHPRQQSERVISGHEAALEVIDLALRSEAGVVNLHRLREELVVCDNNVGL